VDPRLQIITYVTHIRGVAGISTVALIIYGREGV